MIVNGFTKNQQKHADIIWNLDCAQRVLDYVKHQKGIDLIDANIALNMLLAESLDVCDLDYVDISEVLTKAMNK